MSDDSIEQVVDMSEHGSTSRHSTLPSMTTSTLLYLPSALATIEQVVDMPEQRSTSRHSTRPSVAASTFLHLPSALPTLETFDIARLPQQTKRTTVLQALARIDHVEVVPLPYQFLHRHHFLVNIYCAVPAGNIPTNRAMRSEIVPSIRVEYTYHNFMELRFDLYGTASTHSSWKECEYCRVIVDRYAHGKKQPHGVLSLVRSGEHVSKVLTAFLMFTLQHTLRHSMQSLQGQPPLCAGKTYNPWKLYAFLFPRT